MIFLRQAVMSVMYTVASLNILQCLLYFCTVSPCWPKWSKIKQANSDIKVSRRSVFDHRLLKVAYSTLKYPTLTTVYIPLSVLVIVAELLFLPA